MKDTYYFQHDYEPTSDPKIITLLGKFGSSGYGIYWRLIEMLHSDDLHRLEKKQFIYLAVAQQMSTDVEHVVSCIDFCIKVCELFCDDETHFWSERVLRNIELRKDLTNKKSYAGKQSALKRRLNKENLTGVEQVLTDVEQNPTKERKGKESKKSIVAVENFTDDQKGIFADFQKWVSENAPRINQLKEPFTIEQLLKLLQKYNSEQLKDIFLAMHNTEPLLKKYRSSYLTALNWLKWRDKK